MPGPPSNPTQTNHFTLPYPLSIQYSKFHISLGLLPHSIIAIVIGASCFTCTLSKWDDWLSAPQRRFTQTGRSLELPAWAIIGIQVPINPHRPLPFLIYACTCFPKELDARSADRGPKVGNSYVIPSLPLPFPLGGRFADHVHRSYSFLFATSTIVAVP